MDWLLVLYIAIATSLVSGGAAYLLGSMHGYDRGYDVGVESQLNWKFRAADAERLHDAAIRDRDLAQSRAREIG